MLSLPGGIGYDPVTRRRTRRGLARFRPWLLPAAVVLAALVVAGRPGGTQPVVLAPTVPAAPAGLVLIAVTPADPAVLDLVVAGSRVDVYAAPHDLALDAGQARPARLVAADALVVGPGSPPADAADGWPGTGAAGAGAGLVPAARPGAAALTLAVTDTEAAALASHPGDGLTVTVRPP